MDMIDLAQQLEQAERDNMIRKTARRPDRAGSETCIDCEETIPLRRRQSLPGVLRCVNCQAVVEEKQK
jgi:phage/conjugal plasmid C-4 type zinc finger TraR family protein